MRLNEILDDFLFEYKDSDKNPESSTEATSFGVVRLMKAIVNLQKTILSCPIGIFNNDNFLDNSLMDL